MKKIVIFGSYNGSSIGDIALLLGLISSVKRVEPECQITVLTTQKIGLKQEINALHGYDIKNIDEVCIFRNKANYKGLKNKFKFYALRLYQKVFNKSVVNKVKVKNILNNADHLIIGGGNLIMDLFPQWPLILNSIIEVANINKIRYSFVGIGAAPISTPLGIKIFTDILNNAYKVYFRDAESLSYCSDILGFKDGDIGVDCVFGIEWKSNAEPEKNLLLNMASVFSKKWPYQSEIKFQKYVQAVSNTIICLMEEKNLNTLVIYNTNYPTDEEAVLELLKLFKNVDFDIDYVKGRLQVYDLLNLCSKSELALVTRLHAGLIAFIAECEIMAIAYQPKVKDVLANIGITKNVIDITEFIQEQKVFNIEGSKNGYMLTSVLKSKLDKNVSTVLGYSTS